MCVSISTSTVIHVWCIAQLEWACLGAILLPKWWAWHDRQSVCVCVMLSLAWGVNTSASRWWMTYSLVPIKKEDTLHILFYLVVCIKKARFPLFYTLLYSASSCMKIFKAVLTTVDFCQKKIKWMLGMDKSIAWTCWYEYDSHLSSTNAQVIRDFLHNLLYWKVAFGQTVMSKLETSSFICRYIRPWRQRDDYLTK